MAGRKFLIAGQGGLNLTKHSVPLETFGARYGEQAEAMRPLLAQYGPAEVRAWAQDLGTPTYVGTSGRVFPVVMRAAPLLKQWLTRLKAIGVRLQTHTRWEGFTDATGRGLRVSRVTSRGESVVGGEEVLYADATILALGGGSWPSLGSDGRWVSTLAAMGVPSTPLDVANCGFACAWRSDLSPHFGQPLNNIKATAFVDGELSCLNPLL
jgi:hypothetical protein